MSKLLRKLMVVVMMGALSTGALAQKDRDKDKRPPKEPVKVIDGKGGSNRPPQPPPRPKDDGGKKKP